MRYEVITAVRMWILRMEAICSTETLVNAYKTTQRHNNAHINYYFTHKLLNVRGSLEFLFHMHCAADMLRSDTAIL
jgi:hypothetical protein